MHNAATDGVYDAARVNVSTLGWEGDKTDTNTRDESWAGAVGTEKGVLVVLLVE